jgi:hypothetical protein
MCHGNVTSWECNPFKQKFIKYQNSCLYLKENTIRLNVNDQLVNAVWENNRCLFLKSYETHKDISGQNAKSYWLLKQAVHIATTGLSSSMTLSPRLTLKATVSHVRYVTCFTSFCGILQMSLSLLRLRAFHSALCALLKLDNSWQPKANFATSVYSWQSVEATLVPDHNGRHSGDETLPEHMFAVMNTKNTRNNCVSYVQIVSSTYSL